MITLKVALTLAEVISYDPFAKFTGPGLGYSNGLSLAECIVRLTEGV